jgi:type IV pilus assembly protein PilP
MTKKKKKSNFLKRFLTVAIALVLVQISSIVFFRAQKDSGSFIETADDAIKHTAGLTDRRATQAKIQLAIVAFKKDTGELPKDLNELRPKYLDPVPVDPETKEPFSFRVDGTRFFVGENIKAEATTAPAISTTPGAEQTAFIYDAAGKRDPFRPFDISPREENNNRTPLEQFELGQFKVTAVLSGESPSASVELSDGKGFIVRKGMKIGLNGGEIIDIQPNKIVILESKVDFTGQKTQNTVELLLRNEDGTKVTQKK